MSVRVPSIDYIYIYIYKEKYIITKINLDRLGGAHGVIVIVAGNGHGDTSSNPGRD